MSAKQTLIPVHVSAKELKYMDFLQKLSTGSDQLVDPDTDLRDYRGLSAVVNSPKVKKIFKGVLHTVKTGTPLPPELDKVYNMSKSQIEKQKVPPIPSDHEASVMRMAKAGEGNDKHLVMMPLDVVKFLDDIQGTKKKETKFGLQEFAFFDNVFEGVATTMNAALPQKEHHFSGDLIGLGALGLSAFFGMQADEEDQDRYEQKKREQEFRNAQNRKRWNQGGLDHMGPINMPTMSRHVQHGIQKPGRFKKGGIVLGNPLKGPGHGQEDLINKDIPEKTWIFDAHTVSNFGNGSSDAGHKEIERLKALAADKMKKVPEIKERITVELHPKKLRKIPCAVANDEYALAPQAVAALGHGSNNLGSKILRELTEDLRVLKISKGKALPPAAPDILHLYKRAAHKHGLEV